MNILVRNCFGRIFSISIKPNDVIKTLKEQIEIDSGIPIINQRLIYGGKILKDSDSIVVYKIPQNALITLVNPVTGGGKSNANVRGRQQVNKSRELVLNVAGESDYGLVTKMLGNKRVEVLIFNSGKSIQCKIAGHVRTWVTKDDVVLVGLRDFQSDRADIIHKYTNEESRKLIKGGYIPNSVSDTIEKQSNETNINFIEWHENADDGNDLKQQNNYDMPPSESEEDSEDDEFLKNI